MSYLGVAHGNGSYVAVMSDGTARTSPDGFAWTNRTTGATGLTRIGFLNGQFAICGVGGRLLTSTDGIAWTSRVSGSTNDLYGVSHGNGTSVAVGYNNTIVTSTDAASWKSATSGSSTVQFSAIAYGNGTFLALGNDMNADWALRGGTIYSSSDGVTWRSYHPRGFDETLRGITYGASMFVIAGGNSIYNSLDGATFTKSFDGGNSGLFTAAYGDGTFVVGGNTNVLTSSNGTSWIGEQTDFSLLNHMGMAFGNGIFVSVGMTIKSSSDGRSWTSRFTVPNQRLLYGVAWGNGRFVAVGANGLIYSSPDGISWTLRSSGTAVTLSGVTYGAGTFVAVGSVAILTSTDGVTWTQRKAPPAVLTGVAYANGTFVAVGSNGAILQSDPLLELCASANLASSDLSFAASGGSGSATVTISGSCLWGAAAMVPWITLTSGQSGSGNGTVGFTVAANSGAARSGTITVAGRSVTVEQAGSTQTLSVTLAGSGSGTVNSNPPGFHCASGTCSAVFTPGSQLELMATPSGSSIFQGWSGGCSGTANCGVTLNADTSVTAVFDSMPELRIFGSTTRYFPTLVAAYAAAANGGSILLQGRAVELPGNFTLSRNVAVNFQGGYDGSFSNSSGRTVLRGVLTIRLGRLTADGLTVH
ncbi:MAG: hypothetical protein A2075_11030 [Geobacteraceae bacterium GWC2_58_44]|nr:MAG: hypothetical protein A2075_11030 [Geobacteraceae bacterium GWC2_58_44]HBG07986.1 hypothetical protein [Geobacter sp.]